jgi:hypothetical protein
MPAFLVLFEPRRSSNFGRIASKSFPHSTGDNMKDVERRRFEMFARARDFGAEHAAAPSAPKPA